MKKNKIIYTLSAVAMACIISFSGVGGSYIQARAQNIVADALWNTEESAWDNIMEYMFTFLAVSGAYIEPTLVGEIIAVDRVNNFFQFMLSDGYTAEQAHDVLCDCGDSTHTSFSGNEHGGGGFIRDGVTQDGDGNVTYSDEVSDLFHDYIVDYMDSNTGYILFKTLKASDLDPTFFETNVERNNFLETINSLSFVHLYLGSDGTGHMSFIPSENVYCNGINGVTLVNTSSGSVLADSKYTDYYLTYSVLEDDWSFHSPYRLATTEEYSSSSATFDFVKNSYSLSSLFVTSKEYSMPYVYNLQFNNFYDGLISSDGRTVKIWYDISKFKQYSVNYQPYYVTQTWNNYDSTIDNSTTITNAEYQYYTDNSQTIYQTIQNNIDNSVTNTGSTLTEADVQNIVNDAVNQIKNEINKDSGDSGDEGNSGSDDSDSGNNEEDSGSGGTGVGDLIDGIGKIFDTILSLIGKLMGVVADFTQSILDLFSGFTTFTDGFSDFLAGAFGFIPPEIWDIVKVGMSLMVLLAVIKFLRK